MKNGTAKRINDKLTYLEDMTADLAKAISNLSVDINKCIKKEQIEADDIIVNDDDTILEPCLPIKSARGRPKKVIKTSEPVQIFQKNVTETIDIGKKRLLTVDQVKKRNKKINNTPEDQAVEIIAIPNEA
jgi:hypothetical protein